jgi:molecular chaperone GrpE
MLEVPSEQETGTIVQEMQAGYMIKDRLLRAAMVGVAKAG